MLVLNAFVAISEGLVSDNQGSFHGYKEQERHLYLKAFYAVFGARYAAPRHRSTQQPNVSKYARSVSNGFLCALEACLVNWELPK